MTTPEAFPNAHLLWSPQDLHARLGEENLVILDTRSTHQVMRGIIPGAAHFDLYGVGLTRTSPEFFEQFTHLMRSQFALRGVGMDTTVVVYEERQTGVRAGRAFWWLEYFGHEDVHVLDGGIAAWRDAGFETTQEMHGPKARSLKIEPREDIFVSADELNTLLGQDEVAILDTRNADEYFGRNTRGGPRGGTIPGGIHLEWETYLDPQGRMKPPAELRTLFESNGVTRDKAIVPF